MKINDFRTRYSNVAINRGVACAIAVIATTQLTGAVAQTHTNASSKLSTHKKKVVQPVNGTAPSPARSAAPAPAHAVEEVSVVGSRSRPLQHESLPATVFDRQDIQRAGISTPQDFVHLTPGVSLIEGNAPSNSQITIRGVSQTYSLTADSPVSVLIDGVPLTSPTDFNQQYTDLETIEVLKGPQNAIYGRNGVAGAIVINTQLPPNKLMASIDSKFTNGGGFNDTLKIGAPIIPNKIAASLVVNEDHLDGFYTNPTTDKKIDYQENQSVRGRVYITPTDNLAIDLKSSWTQLYGGGLAYHAQTATNPYYTGRLPDVNNTSAPYVADLPNLARTLKNSDSMRIDWDIPYGKVSSVSSYDFNKDLTNGSLFPYLPTPYGTADNTQAGLNVNTSYFQELKFASIKKYNTRIQFGADYYDFVRRNVSNTGVTYDGHQYDGIGPFPAGSENPTLAFADDEYHTKAWELFAEATYDVTSKLSIDGAVRYTRDDVRDRNLTPAEYTTDLGAIRTLAFSKAEPRITVTYHFTRDFNVYADWALGSLPGGFNPTGSTTTIKAIYPTAVVGDTYKQETSRNWEVGFNSQWLHRRLTLNGAFYYDIMGNQQYNLYYPAASIEVMNTIDTVHNIGGELQAIFVPAKGWRVSAVGSYIHSEIMNFAADPSAVGNRPPYTPEYNFSFAIDKDFRITDKIDGFGRFEDDVKGTEFWEADNIPGARSNVINLASIRVGARAKHWSITGFVTNLADNRYNITNVVLSSQAVATQWAPPRIYGVEITAGF